MAKKVCLKCRAFVTGTECLICKGNKFTESWKGRINVLDAEKSEIAKKVGISAKGEYVLKTR